MSYRLSVRAELQTPCRVPQQSRKCERAFLEDDPRAQSAVAVEARRRRPGNDRDDGGRQGALRRSKESARTSESLQSKRVLRTGGKDARPLEAEVGIAWRGWPVKTAKDGPQRQGRKGTLGKRARPY